MALCTEGTAAHMHVEEPKRLYREGHVSDRSWHGTYICKTVALIGDLKRTNTAPGTPRGCMSDRGTDAPSPPTTLLMKPGRRK